MMDASATMMDTRPAPLVAADVDLRDFAFLPLDVLRLRDSELASAPDAEVFRCAVLSWCAAWHQMPAASLPDDDVSLARLLGYGRDIKGWKKIRAAGGMRGWVKCSDGRLYHPVVAEKARDAWRGKLQQRWRTEAARVKKHNQRHRLDGAAAVQVPEFDEWMSLGCPQGQPLHVPSTVPGETASKGQGEGQGEGQGQGQGQGDLVVLGGAGGTAPDAGASAATRGARLRADWALPKAWGDWALTEHPHWTADTVRSIAEGFRDHWVAKAGADARRVDWLATWRNWCRSDITQRQHPKAGALSLARGATPSQQEAIEAPANRAGAEWLAQQGAA